MAEEVTSPEKLPKAPPVLPDDEVLYLSLIHISEPTRH